MAEWSTSKQQQKKERRARRQPAWEKAADEAFERSGAAFMMAAAAGAFGTDARLSLVVLCGIPGCGKSTLAAALKAKGFVVVCQGARLAPEVMARKKHATLPAAPASLGIVDRFAKEFEPARCEAALKKARGDEDAAVDLLLTEPAAALAL
ncbi:hypothetical protein SO694_00043065 [Aureococcus anophagefferens]|uniref:Zeta toxin domain-containing protein n=1 Tax=Aureococcus anophagefferens TaxID=44056 RepID=A0ABR1G6S2_AURAN